MRTFLLEGLRNIHRKRRNAVTGGSSGGAHARARVWGMLC